MKEDRIDGALKSRMVPQSIEVTQDEMLELIEMVLPYVRMEDNIPIEIKRKVLELIKIKESKNPAVLSGENVFGKVDNSGRIQKLNIDTRRIVLALDIYMTGDHDWQRTVFGFA